MFNFEKYWEKHGYHTTPAILGLAIKEVAEKAVNAALSYTPVIPNKPRVKFIRKAFNKHGEEVPYAIEDGDFTWDLPEGFTLKKEKKHVRKRRSNS